MHSIPWMTDCVKLQKIKYYIKLAGFRYVVFLSIGFLIYDVFMVHITPFFKANRKSIMIEVAVQPASDGNLDR